MTKIIDLKAQGFRFTFRAGSGWNWRHPAELQPTDIDATDMKDEELVPLAKDLEALAAAPSDSSAYLGVAIGTAFAGVLKRWLSAEAWAEMREANVGADPMTCASHDYCDANVAMLEAFRTVMSRDHVLDETDPRNDGDSDLWNIAWDIAKRLYLTGEEGAQ